MKEIYGFIGENNEGAIITVKIVPGSSFSKIIDFTDEFVRIKISSPPIENKANKELISFLSSTLDVNKSKIKIISGEKSKIKKILIEKETAKTVSQKFSL